MKRLSFFLMAAVLALNSIACQSPVETAYVARGTFNQSVRDLTAAREANIIDAKSFAADVAVADKIVPALDALDVAATGEAWDFWALYRELEPKIHDLATKAILTKKGGK